MTLQGVTGALVESCTLGLEFNQMQDMYYRTTYASSFNSEWFFLKFTIGFTPPNYRKSPLFNEEVKL